MANLKIGEQIELEIAHITGDGKGIAWGQNDRLFLIDNVEEGDNLITAKIEHILEEIVLGKKIGGTKTIKQPKSRGIVDSPYEMDEDGTIEEESDGTEIE
jgi:hypothetical protein